MSNGNNSGHDDLDFNFGDFGQEEGSHSGGEDHQHHADGGAGDDSGFDFGFGDGDGPDPGDFDPTGGFDPSGGQETHGEGAGGGEDEFGGIQGEAQGHEPGFGNDGDFGPVDFGDGEDHNTASPADGAAHDGSEEEDKAAGDDAKKKSLLSKLILPGGASVIAIGVAYAAGIPQMFLGSHHAQPNFSSANQAPYQRKGQFAAHPVNPSPVQGANTVPVEAAQPLAPAPVPAQPTPLAAAPVPLPQTQTPVETPSMPVAQPVPVAPQVAAVVPQQAVPVVPAVVSPPAGQLPTIQQPVNDDKGPEATPTDARIADSLSALTDAIKGLNTGFKALGDKIDNTRSDLGGRLDTAGAKIADIDTHVNTLQQRETNLEQRISALEVARHPSGGGAEAKAPAVRSPHLGGINHHVGTPSRRWRRLHAHHAAEVPAAAPAPTVTGLSLAGVSRDAALVQTPTGVVRVSLGEALPNGIVARGIRRDGSQWVLETSAGVIRQ